MKHFIIEITYTAPFEQVVPVLPEHRQFLDDGYRAGWLLCSGPQVPKTGGMVVARAPSMEALQDFFSRDPYHLKGLASYRWIEFEPVKHQEFLRTWVSG